MNWEQIPLGEVTVKIGSGITPRGGSSVYTDYGTALIRSQNVLDLSFSESGLAYISDEHANKMKRHVVLRNDILLNITGDSTARVTYWNGRYPAVVNQHVAVIRPNEARINSRWLQYYLVEKSTKDYLLTLAASGGSRPALTKGMLNDLLIPLPRLAEQKAIADVLGALDDKIAANQRVISDAAELCEALVQKSISGEFTKLSEIAVITMGTSPKGEDLNEEGRGIPFFQGVRDFGDISPKRRVCTDKPLRTAEPGDVLLAVRAPVGQVNLALEKVCIGRGLAAVRSAINSPVSLFYLLRSHREIWQDFDGNGTVFSSVNRSDAHNVLVPIILPTKQKDLEKVLNTIHGRLLKAQKENQVLAATRDELLPLLMNGKITVAEVKEAAGDVGVVKQKQQEDGDSDV
ncbi:restriction endonuclease subunit S [Corynebacterium pseudodiphtheriticum]|uniref:restriction endonuclease subunit S n=1 Tax=Corynebacterium pseudodiphtheriticum TaxID=37637 RepID=UPI001EF6F6D6|nr:restriction endonuclease subunit S [Corynebacterium pseudodiphtheriticum]MCG7251257.1 restriction endonuclease subunit S [Corynebacterium pseudodiphtheriticum]MCT1635682.1 restriction endonuclease subunit S [Corynebacterium pseudodiphtheriticum]MCT1666823.1 restriction endonuclease subunit S [Corynebacterium pseudodiphtheriticum]MDK4206361.1 restriction endonuclease subunit S [Corynebacterium pseudodiphtheriticum]MDK4237670.1 restriction endonuclease subunit S [Corynebacterium pseudodiphthe